MARSRREYQRSDYHESPKFGLGTIVVLIIALAIATGATRVLFSTRPGLFFGSWGATIFLVWYLVRCLRTGRAWEGSVVPGRWRGRFVYRDRDSSDFWTMIAILVMSASGMLACAIAATVRMFQEMFPSAQS